MTGFAEGQSKVWKFTFSSFLCGIPWSLNGRSEKINSRTAATRTAPVMVIVRMMTMLMIISTDIEDADDEDAGNDNGNLIIEWMFRLVFQN